MTNRPIDEPTGSVGAPDEVAPNPETDTVGRPQPDQDQPAEVETGEAAEDPTRIAETEEAEEPAGVSAADEAEPGQMPDHDTEIGA